MRIENALSFTRVLALILLAILILIALIAVLAGDYEFAWRMTKNFTVALVINLLAKCIMELLPPIRKII